jgi:cold shock CspA family protein
MSKQLGVVRAWNPDKGFGFLRFAEIDWRGDFVMINDRNRPDTFLHAKMLTRAGINPDSVRDGIALRFDLQQNPRFSDGRLEASRIELV